ncbi:hypothetical protein ACB092_01G368900 [Castanea dentata]
MSAGSEKKMVFFLLKLYFNIEFFTQIVRKQFCKSGEKKESIIIGYHLEKGCIGFRPCGLGFAKRLHKLESGPIYPSILPNGTKSSSAAALIESSVFLF